MGIIQTFQSFATGFVRIFELFLQFIYRNLLN
jgi:hypothetical protein